MGIIAWFKRLFGGKPKSSTDRPGKAITAPAPPPFMTAGDFLQHVRRLQQSNAQWPEIWQTLNPDGNREVEALLIELRNRGIQFQPHVGLNQLEEGCKAARPDADRVAVLRAVLKMDDPLDRFH